MSEGNIKFSLSFISLFPAALTNEDKVSRKAQITKNEDRLQAYQDEYRSCSFYIGIHKEKFYSSRKLPQINFHYLQWVENYPSTLYSSFPSFFFALWKTTSELLLVTSCSTLRLVYMPFISALYSFQSLFS